MDRRTAESRHRLIARVGMGVLVAVSVAPVTGYVGRVAAPLVEQCRELLAQCALVLRAGGAPLRWLPLALLVAGVVYAVADRVRAARRTARALAAHPTRPTHPGEPVGRLAREFGVESRVRVLVGPAPNPAFAAGLLRPHVYVSDALQHALTPSELRAVFRHELHHLAHRDPLRFAGLCFAAKSLFWLPVIGWLAEELMYDAELRADDFAASPRGGVDPLDVATALIKIGRARAATHAPALAATAGIGGFRLLDRRVRRLADDVVPPPASLPRWPLARSAAAVAVLWLAATFVPGPATAGMTMRWGDPCPHDMAALARYCPECDRSAGRMRGCPMAEH